MGRTGSVPTSAITDDSSLGGQIIQGSTIFDTNHSAYLSRTPSSAGNRKTYTVSAAFFNIPIKSSLTLLQQQDP